MKKLFNLAIILALCVGFSSCSSDDDEGNDISSLIIGKWQMYETTAPDYYYPCEYLGWDEYKSDGKYNTYDACEGKTYTGSYTLNGKNLTVIPEIIPIPFIFTIVSVTETELVGHFELFGNKVTNKFKRIN
jgi:hypothetical protein